MGYRIRLAIPEDEQRIRELFIEIPSSGALHGRTWGRYGAYFGKHKKTPG